MLRFGRDVCGDFQQASQHEWLVTNGLGGYASGTISGALTRRYHGLLIAALQPPVGRTLMLTKLDETATYGGTPYLLYANMWENGVIDAPGLKFLESFHLEGTTPVWTFAFGDALLEKRVWMERDANRTFIAYKLVRASQSVALSLKALVNYRDHHGNIRTDNWVMDISHNAFERVLSICAYDGATDFYIKSEGAVISPQHEWYRGYNLSEEAYRGLASLEDHLYAGEFKATLKAGETLTLAASTEPVWNIGSERAGGQPSRGERVLTERVGHKTQLIRRSPFATEPDDVQQLVLAADQFVVRRPLPDEPEGYSIIAGYHWFGDWGRDTMIALPGLTLTTGRPEVARKILHTFASFVDQGMLPNNFPEGGIVPGYNTVDATLWYFEAIRAYIALTGDDELLRELYPVLAGIIDWHVRGTRYQIHVDPVDGLLYAGEEGVQLTWMDAKIGDWVVTPRTGKAVEINALWYNALCSMAEFARHIGESAEPYEERATQVAVSFARFWSVDNGYCYDVLDTPQGDDASLRPNQLVAVSLHYCALMPEQQKGVVDVCARKLWTSHGLRSLSPDDSRYVGHYGGDSRQRDSVYHQGTAWAWLVGPFVLAHLRVYNDPQIARSFLESLLQHISGQGMGSLGEVSDGDAPFTPRGAIAQAWSVAEFLRAWQAMRTLEDSVT